MISVFSPLERSGSGQEDTSPLHHPVPRPNAFVGWAGKVQGPRVILSLSYPFFLFFLPSFSLLTAAVPLPPRHGATAAGSRIFRRGHAPPVPQLSSQTKPGPSSSSPPGAAIRNRGHWIDFPPSFAGRQALILLGCLILGVGNCCGPPCLGGSAAICSPRAELYKRPVYLPKFRVLNCITCRTFSSTVTQATSNGVVLLLLTPHCALVIGSLSNDLI